MRLHFVTTVEDRPDYHAMVRLWAFSIRRRAGMFAEAPISVAFNERMDAEVARALEADLGVKCVVKPRISAKMRYANKYNALDLPGLLESDAVMFFDTDTVVLEDLAPLAEIVPTADVWGVNEYRHERIFGLDRLFERYAGVTAGRAGAYRHAWNPMGLPYLNGGVWIVRTAHLAAFRERVLELTFELFAAMSAGGGKPLVWPLHWLRIQWNRAHYKRRPGWVLKPYFPKFYSDQMAIGLAAASLGLKLGILPRSYNWCYDVEGQGETRPVRVLHYAKIHYPLECERLLDGGWAAEYAASGQPGKVGMAALWREHADRYGVQV